MDGSGHILTLGATRDRLFKNQILKCVYLWGDETMIYDETLGKVETAWIARVTEQRVIYAKKYTFFFYLVIQRTCICKYQCIIIHKGRLIQNDNSVNI